VSQNVLIPTVAQLAFAPEISARIGSDGCGKDSTQILWWCARTLFCFTLTLCALRLDRNHHRRRRGVARRRHCPSSRGGCDNCCRVQAPRKRFELMVHSARLEAYHARLN
jgi:hypothetical protein